MLSVIIVSCVLCILYAWRRRQKYLEGKLPPISGGAWPMVGHLHLWMTGLFWSRLLKMQKDCLEKGGLTYMYSGINSAYTFFALCDPKECNTVANDCHQKAFLLEGSVKSIFGKGLASAPVWENHRRLLEKVFEEIHCSDVINSYAKQLVNKLSEKSGKGLFDQTEYLQQTIMRILFSIIFGNEEESTRKFKDEHIQTYESALQKLSGVLFARYNSFYMHKKLFFNCSRLKWKLRECTRDIRRLTNENISTRKAEFIKNLQVTAPTCFLDALIHLESQSVYSEQQITDEVITIIYGGYDTLVDSLVYVLVMLGSHTDVQDKVYLEIQNICGDKKKHHLDTNDLTKLVYLEAVIMEVLRLYPPVATISRVTNSTMEIKKYSLDPGTQCLLFLYAMNRHPSWGEDRETFRPERWLDSSPSLDHCATFGLGKRSCIGKKLSLSTMKIILVHLLREYKIISDHTKMVVTHKILLTPVSGHHIALERRNKTEVITIHD